MWIEVSKQVPIGLRIVGGGERQDGAAAGTRMRRRDSMPQILPPSLLVQPMVLSLGPRHRRIFLFLALHDPRYPLRVPDSYNRAGYVTVIMTREGGAFVLAELLFDFHRRGLPAQGMLCLWQSSLCSWVYKHG